MPLDPQRFRDTMGHVVTGVCVIAVRDADGAVLGMTASSVASLSLDPPMLLLCVGLEAEIHDPIVRAPAFGVSVLAAGQEELAVRFATQGRQRFDDPSGEVTPGGLPRLKGAIAHLECRRGEVFRGGDHSIVTGTVEWAATPGGPPLCYFRSAYGSVGRR